MRVQSVLLLNGMGHGKGVLYMLVFIRQYVCTCSTANPIRAYVQPILGKFMEIRRQVVSGHVHG